MHKINVKPRAERWKNLPKMKKAAKIHSNGKDAHFGKREKEMRVYLVERVKATLLYKTNRAMEKSEAENSRVATTM